MEKDYFTNRSPESKVRSAIYIGQSVYICEKQAQKYAKKMSDLTYGTVIQILTRHDHPRGIKVKILDENREEKIGRVVYVCE